MSSARRAFSSSARSARATSPAATAVAANGVVAGVGHGSAAAARRRSRPRPRRRRSPPPTSATARARRGPASASSAAAASSPERRRPAEGHSAGHRPVAAHHDHRDPGGCHTQRVRRERAADGRRVVGPGQVDALRQLDPPPRAAAERDEQQRVARVEPDEVGQCGEQLAGVAQPGDRRGGRGGRSGRCGRCHAARLPTAAGPAASPAPDGCGQPGGSASPRGRERGPPVDNSVSAGARQSSPSVNVRLSAEASSESRGWGTTCTYAGAKGMTPCTTTTCW